MKDANPKRYCQACLGLNTSLAYSGPIELYNVLEPKEARCKYCDGHSILPIPGCELGIDSATQVSWLSSRKKWVSKRD